MSTTYHIGCRTCKEYMWIGQSNGYTPLYIYTTEVESDLLATFLKKHSIDPVYYNLCNDEDVLDHLLVFGASEMFWDCEDWKEIETDVVKGGELTYVDKDNSEDQ